MHRLLFRLALRVFGFFWFFLILLVLSLSLLTCPPVSIDPRLSTTTTQTPTTTTIHHKPHNPTQLGNALRKAVAALRERQQESEAAERRRQEDKRAEEKCVSWCDVDERVLGCVGGCGLGPSV